MKFITKVYHPNISSASGAICLDILKDAWSPVGRITNATRTEIRDADQTLLLDSNDARCRSSPSSPLSSRYVVCCALQNPMTHKMQKCKCLQPSPQVACFTLLTQRFYLLLHLAQRKALLGRQGRVGEDGSLLDRNLRKRVRECETS